MKFWKAMKIVDEGGMVQRRGWDGEDWVIRKGKSSPIILIENMFTHNTASSLNTFDMDANDWVVADPEKWRQVE